MNNVIHIPSEIDNRSKSLIKTTVSSTARDPFESLSATLQNK